MRSQSHPIRRRVRSGSSQWGAITDLWNDADYNFQRHDAAAIDASAKNKNLGIVVVIISAIVSTSVFGALTQKDPNLIIQICTGILSVLATVLASVQTFYGFADAATNHNKAANEFLSIRRQIEIFLQRYEIANLDEERLKEAQKREGELMDAFDAIRASAPIVSHAEEVEI